MDSLKSFCIREPNLIGAMLLLQIGYSEGKAFCTANSGISTHFMPELTAFYPFKISQTNTALSQYDFLYKLSAPFLHLLYQTRIFTFHLKEQPGPKQLALTDKLLGRDREMASFPIDATKMDQLNFLLEFGFSKGALVVEYRFDRTMAIIEMIAQAKKYGLNMDSLQQNNYQQCSPYKANQMVFNNQTIHCTNGLNLHFGTFRISMYSVLNNTYLNVERFNKTPDPNAYRTIKNLIEKVGVKVNDQHLEELEALIKHPSSNEISPSHIGDCDLSQMSSIYPNLEKKICKELGITCKYKNKVPDKLFFRIHQQTCEEKYDLAKQTGIDYEHFAWLYHRFAPIINELIEYAYELFNDEKNAKVVWKQVEIKAIQQMVCW